MMRAEDWRRPRTAVSEQDVFTAVHESRAPDHAAIGVNRRDDANPVRALNNTFGAVATANHLFICAAPAEARVVVVADNRAVALTDDRAVALTDDGLVALFRFLAFGAQHVDPAIFTPFLAGVLPLVAIVLTIV